jgi:hypothetical protein
MLRLSGSGNVCDITVESSSMKGVQKYQKKKSKIQKKACGLATHHAFFLGFFYDACGGRAEIASK